VGLIFLALLVGLIMMIFSDGLLWIHSWVLPENYRASFKAIQNLQEIVSTGKKSKYYYIIITLFIPSNKLITLF